MKTAIWRPRCIVVGVDHDPASDHAVRAGLELAERFDAGLELVHAVPAPPAMYAAIEAATLVQLAEEARNAARTKLVARVRTVLQERGREGVEEHFHFGQGPAAPVLVREARRLGADVIVLGPHEKRGVLDLGRTARGVLAHAPDSAWVQPGPVRPVRRILAPVDLSQASLKALARACTLAAEFGARVEVLHCFHYLPLESVYPEYAALSSYSIDDLRQASRSGFDTSLSRFDWQGVEHEAAFVDGEPAETILSRQDAADLIVMATHGHGGLVGLFLGSVAYSVLKRARTPVLAIRSS